MLWSTDEPGRRPRGFESKVRGCLLGVVVGDALGAPFEGSTAPPIDDKFAPTANVARYTDDTHMTIGVAQSLIDCRGFDGAHMAYLLKANYESEPWRGYGSGPPEVFRNLERGLAWDKAAHSLFGGAGSFGNGAAMRVAPLAAMAFDSYSVVEEIARQSAIITHTHELGREAAVLQALSISFLIRREPADGLQVDSLLREIAGKVSNDVYRDRLQAVAALLPSAGPDEVIARLGNSTAAFESVPTALFCFLKHHDSFEATVRFAISLGGDTDTIASMAAALSGAFLGEEAIPYEWIRRVEGQAQILSLADELVALHYLPSTLR